MKNFLHAVAFDPGQDDDPAMIPFRFCSTLSQMLCRLSLDERPMFEQALTSNVSAFFIHSRAVAFDPEAVKENMHTFVAIAEQQISSFSRSLGFNPAEHHVVVSLCATNDNLYAVVDLISRRTNFLKIPVSRPQ